MDRRPAATAYASMKPRTTGDACLANVDEAHLYCKNALIDPVTLTFDFSTPKPSHF